MEADDTCYPSGTDAYYNHAVYLKNRTGYECRA